ncbi:succinylglutamate desuccinylase/aspartoacylase family protein [Paenibacillus solisilvae]|uniref:Succinylglutamate desuccinylase/aspartoacylase family protein n=1 Tax=Paenibacillus solisilvae TaxID=2486751 RepID=A0ABW0VP94_9BACL
MRETIALRDIVPGRFAPGYKGWVNAMLGESLMGTLAVPVAVARGLQGGPLMVVTAGVHGDEFEGMEAIRELFAGLKTENLSGTFIAVPVVNPFSYEGQQRETPFLWDGLNLARQFPGSDGGSPTRMLAHRWSSWLSSIMSQQDVFIDFHSAGTRYEYVSMIGYHAVGGEMEAASRKLSEAFGMDRLWRIPDHPDTHVTFNGWASRQGIPTIATEVCGRGGSQLGDVEELISGLLRVLRYKGMLAGESEQSKTGAANVKQVWSTDWVLVRSAGFFRPFVSLLQQVHEGQTIGEIVTISGEPVEKIISTVSGVIWGIRRFCTVREGDYVYLTACQEEEELL